MSTIREDLLAASQAMAEGDSATVVVICERLLATQAGTHHDRIAARRLLSDALVFAGQAAAGIAQLGLALQELPPPDTEELRRLTKEVLMALYHRHYEQGQYRQALDSLLRLCALAADEGDLPGFIAAQTGIANLFAAHGDWRRALGVHERSLQYDHELLSAEPRIVLRLHIVGCLLPLKKCKAALQLLDECEGLLGQLSENALRAEVELYRGLAWQELGDWEAALHSLDIARQLAAASTLVWIHIKSLLHSGQCLLAANRAGEALEALEQALSICQRIGMPLQEQLCEEMRSQACERMGQYGEALASERRAHAISLKLVRQTPMAELRGQSLRQLKRMEERMRFNLSRQENAALREAQAEQRDTLQRLQDEIHTDPLTGTFNRRWLDAELERRVAQKNRKPFALMLLDVDHFKEVNDLYSHLAGDAVLRELGTLLRRFSRNDDQAARYGGEEFVMLVNQSEPGTVAAIAERLRLNIAEHSWLHVLPDRGVTISVGVAIWRPGETQSDLLARADEALYRAKHAGRNRVAME